MPFHFFELLIPVLIVFCAIIALVVILARLWARQERPQQLENRFQTYQKGYQQVEHPFSQVSHKPENQNSTHQDDQPQAEYPHMPHPEERSLQ